MGARMVQDNGLAALEVDTGIHPVTDCQHTLGHTANMGKGITLLLRILHFKTRTRSLQSAAVADLTTGFGIKRGLLQHHNPRLPVLQTVDGHAVMKQCRYL